MLEMPTAASAARCSTRFQRPKTAGKVEIDGWVGRHLDKEVDHEVAASEEDGIAPDGLCAHITILPARGQE